MSNENKTRILYVQPGKYPEERLVANELHPLQRLVGGYMQAVYPWSKDKVFGQINLLIWIMGDYFPSILK